MAPAPAAASQSPARLPSVELLLMRHADAERKAATDFARILTKKGREDAALAGRRLAELGLRPDAVLCSPAPRALETAQLTVAGLGPDPPEIRQEAMLYESSLDNLSKALAQHAGAARRLLVVGHNPGLSDLASWLASLPSGWSLSKAATAQLRLRSTWTDMSRGCGRLVDVHEEM